MRLYLLYLHATVRSRVPIGQQRSKVNIPLDPRRLVTALIVDDEAPHSVVLAPPLASLDALRRLRATLLEDQPHDIIVARRAERVLELLLGRRAEDALCTLPGGEDLECCRVRSDGRDIVT